MSASTPAPRDGAGGAERLAAALLLLLVAIFHGPSLKHGFVYDDAWTVVGNSFIRAPGNLLALLGPGPSEAGVPDAGRPTMLASEILDHALWGLSPGGFHLQNLLWHALVVLLLYTGLRRLVGSFLVPFSASALFAVHPVNVEAVAAINYREDLLAAAFVLLALQGIYAARNLAGWGGVGRAAAVLAMLLASLAKENAAVAPLLLAAIDVCHEPGKLGQTLRRHLRDYVVLAAPLVATFAWRWWVIGGPGLVSRSAEVPERHLDRWSTIPAAAWSLLAGAGKMVFPWGLSPEYAEPHAGAAGILLGSVALLALVAAAILALRLRGRAPWLALGVLVGILGYLPNLGLFPLTNLRADRYLYLPSLGLCLALASLLVGGLARIRRLREGSVLDLPATWVAVLVCVLVLGLRTLRQGRIWKSDLALWRHASEVAPDSSRTWLNLATAELHAEMTVEALVAVERSLALADDAHARELRALVRLAQGDLATAQAELEPLAGAPGLTDQHRAQVLNNLGFVELRLARREPALERFAQAERLAPRYEQPSLNAARALAELGHSAEAEARLRALLSRVPESVEAWRQLALLLAAQGRQQEAAAASANAEKLAPQ